MEKDARQRQDGAAQSGGTPAFIHLRAHSAYSLLEGALKIDKIIAHAQRHSAPAVAITDSNNLFGALEFSQKAMKAGVQPIIGCKLDIDFNDEGEEQGAGRARLAVQYPSLILLAADEEGYYNLVRLVSRAYLDKTDMEAPHIRAAWLGEGMARGIIALTGGFDGPINRLLLQDKGDLALKRLNLLHEYFGDRLYVELERCGRYDKAAEKALVELAYEQNLPLVATNEAFFLQREDYEAHDALLAVAAGQALSVTDRRRVSPEHYLKTAEEMAALFADIPEAVENTVEIARRCHICAPSRKPILPNFVESGQDLSDGDAVFQAEAAVLAEQARLGLRRRLAMAGLAEGYSEKDYQERLEYELAIITRMRFPGYFLIVADFIKWAKTQKIPVGPGRGSGAGSLVAYALTITDIDPLRFSLLFERFLNPDRVSMPDFDIDFCQERREEVIHYVQGKYGRDQVAQIITFGTLQARAVLRDVGRVLEMPYGQVDRLCKLVPSNPANPISLAKAIADEPKFAEEKEKDARVSRLLAIAQKLEGLYRHASTHAAGIVIGDRPLSQLVPMYRDPRSDMAVTQFNMKYVEQAGLVKFDFLGLKTLTILQTAADFVKRRGIEIDLAHIALNDKETYQMLAKGDTVGVFQVESAGMRKALLGMKPDRIEDIIALVALYRPGPMENIPTYNARKNGDEEIASVHPLIDALLGETQGVIVYQEQVMQIAQILSGYSLGEADLLRRAMGKKIRAEMDKQRTRFVEGALKKGLSNSQANTIFDLLAKFADYGFNKSHAAAYAVVSYQTAYLKAHYPVEFLAASMTYDMLNTDRLNDFRFDAQKHGIRIVPPSVQTSHRQFEVGENTIYYSLAAIKGVGEMVAEHIAAARGETPFKNLEDFCARIDPRIVNKRAWESLIQAGALDCFGIRREVLLAGLGSGGEEEEEKSADGGLKAALSGRPEKMKKEGGILAYAQRLADDKTSGQIDIFAASGGAKEVLALPQETELWPAAEKLQREFQALGFYLSAHPLDEYKDVLKRKSVETYQSIDGKTGHRVLAGTVSGRQIRKTRAGKKMAVVQMSDSGGQYELVLFEEELEKWGNYFETGKSLLVTVNAEKREDDVSLRLQSAESLEGAAQKVLTRGALDIYPDLLQPIDSFIEKLKLCLGAPAEGGGSIYFVFAQNLHDKSHECVVSLGKYPIMPQMIAAIKALSGVSRVKWLEKPRPKGEAE